MTRRTKGEGSIFWSRSEKTWVAKITLPDGKEARKRNKDRQIVADWLFEQRKAVSENRPIADDKITFAEFSERFLVDVAKHTLKPKTYQSYEYILTYHAIPELGRIKLSSLRPHHLQNLYAKKLESGLSKKTVHHIHSTIRRVLNEAVKWQIIYSNPCSSVTPPRVEKKLPRVWTVKQAQKFLSASAEHRWHAIYLIALTTGARRGEILGMQWENIDWDKGTISIEKSVIVVNNRAVISEPKTKYARRTISLPKIVLDTLDKNRKEEGLIFQTSTGNPISPRNLLRHFKEATKEAGLPEIRFHDLRHTAATILLQQDVHPKKVQELLGHSSITTTLDVYSHLIPSMHSEAADKMDEVFKL